MTHSIHSTYVSSDLLAPPRNDKLRAYILKILEELQASSANTRIGLTLSDVYFTWSWTNANISVDFQHNIVSECTENPRNTSSETMRLPDDSVIIHPAIPQLCGCWLPVKPNLFEYQCLLGVPIWSLQPSELDTALSMVSKTVWQTFWLLICRSCCRKCTNDNFVRPLFYVRIT